MKHDPQDSIDGRFSTALKGAQASWVISSTQELQPQRLLEIALLIAAGLLLSVLLRPQDPFWVRGDYPWIWLMPTVVALRYGALSGLFGAFVILALGFAMPWMHRPPVDFSAAFLAGGLAQVLIVGHVSDRWSEGNKHHKGVNQYLTERLRALTTAQYLLRVSHDRLEQEVYIRPVTLRGAIERLREILPVLHPPSSGEKSPLLGNTQDLLELLSMLFQLTQAAIYPVSDLGKLLPQPVATIGPVSPLLEEDPVLVHAVERRRLTHLKEVLEESPQHYLMAAPIVTDHTPIVAMLVVSDMSFLSLNQENLEFLQVLLDYYADSVFQSELVRPILEQVPECQYRFGVELARAGQLRARFEIRSSLVALSFPQGGRHDTAFQDVLRQLRSLDLYWEEITQGRQHALVLLPLTQLPEVDEFLLRIDGGLKTHFELSLEDPGIHTYTLLVDAVNPAGELFLLRQMMRAL